MKKYLALFMCLVLLLSGCASNNEIVEPSEEMEETEPTELPLEQETQERESFGLSYLTEYGLNPYLCAATANRAIFLFCMRAILR